MAKYKVTVSMTSSDYEEISWFGFITTRKGQKVEIVVEADDPDIATNTVRQIVGNRGKLLEARKD
jgi:hypothetical protein